MLNETGLWRDAGSVLLYRSIGSEVATQSLFDRAWAEGKRVAAPRLVEGAIRAVVVERETLFEPGAFGVPEPGGRLEPEGAHWGLVVVPGIAFDARGHRLGYGKGHFDAFLARVEATATVGLTYRETFVDRLPVDPHDVPVEWVVTPNGIHAATT